MWGNLFYSKKEFPHAPSKKYNFAFVTFNYAQETVGRFRIT